MQTLVIDLTLNAQQIVNTFLSIFIEIIGNLIQSRLGFEELTLLDLEILDHRYFTTLEQYLFSLSKTLSK